MMTRLLGEPDEIVRNPHGTFLADMRLFDLRRVIAAERSEGFRNGVNRPTDRERGRPRNPDREQERVTQLKKPVHAPRLLTRFPEIDVDEARRLAIGGHNNYVRRTGDGDEIDWSAPREAIDRLTVNYVRHRFTSYDEGIRSIPRAKGSARALDAFRRAVYEAITEQWPELAQECIRQRGQRMTNW
jgi:hypothetical protein